MSDSDLLPANIANENSIRLAQPNEVNTVCEILASAFADDPVMAWMSGHPQIYATLFRSEAVPLYMKQGHVFINQSNTGAAMWIPPGVSHQPPLHWTTIPLIWAMFKTGGLTSLKRGDLLEKAFKEHHYSKPHFYLHAIGALQGQQGKGIGSSLLQAGLKSCDQQHSAAYLESSNIKNNPLYERFGFEVIGELTLPENGPTVWRMLRSAR